MHSRRNAFLALAVLFLAVLSALPAAAAEPTGTSCVLLPWEEAAAAPVTPIVDDQPQPFFAAGCTNSSQCLSGYNCHCGKCHLACPSGQRWSCGCQTCYVCPSGYFFNPDVCYCEPI